jgi:hypothetical protein
MIAFCAWFSSRDESSGIGEPPRGGPHGRSQTAFLFAGGGIYRAGRVT